MNTTFKHRRGRLEGYMGFGAFARLQQARENLGNEDTVRQKEAEFRQTAEARVERVRQELKRLETELSEAKFRKVARAVLEEEVRLSELAFKGYIQPTDPESPYYTEAKN